MRLIFMNVGAYIYHRPLSAHPPYVLRPREQVFWTCCMRYLHKMANSLLPFSYSTMYRVFRKNCVFSQFTETHPSPTSLKQTFKALNAMLLAIIWPGRCGKLSRISLKKTQYLMNSLYNIHRYKHL